jgi:Transmembrane domain of unknown function (DUF3566)
VGTKEDGVDEAGRTTEPPLKLAPPGRDADPDGETAEAVVDNKVMSSSRTSSDSGLGAAGKADNAHADADTSGAKQSLPPVPFPADEIGKPRGSSPESSGTPDTREARDGGEREDGAGSGNGKLDSGRQAVRQAMAATNSWFTARSAKAASAAEQESPPVSSASTPPPSETASAADTKGSGGSGVFISGDGKPSFTPPTPQDTQEQPNQGGGRSLWRDVRPPARPAASSSSPASNSGTAAQPAPSSYPYSGSTYPPPSAYQGPATASRPTGPGAAGASPGTPGRSAGVAGFSAGAASAVTGAAAGLAGYASSVTTALQNRTPGTKGKRGTKGRRSARRQAQLTLARVEPWSVMKFSFVVSVVAFIILFVAVAVLYMVLSSLGVFTSLQHTVSTITSSQSSAGTNISAWFSASRILGYTGMLGALNIVLITAMCTIGSVIYNLIAKTIGGIEITLRETE